MTRIIRPEQYGDEIAALWDLVIAIKTAPLLNNAAVSDLAGVPRVEIGNLPARGISPAHYGIRVNDASGNPIFDSQGIMQPVSLLGTGADASPSTITAATFTVIPGMSATFSLSRPAFIFFEAIVNGKTAGGAGSYSFCDLFVDGVDTYSPGLFDKLNGYTQVTDAHFTEAQYAAGSHTIDVRIKCDAGQTWTNYTSSLYCYLIGG